jgi:hypothetical protein
VHNSPLSSVRFLLEQTFLVVKPQMMKRRTSRAIPPRMTPISNTPLPGGAVV